MTTPEPQSSSPQSPEPVSKDRVYRSPAGLAGGVLLLALALWLGIDAVVAGEGRTPWVALAALLFLVPSSPPTPCGPRSSPTTTGCGCAIPSG